jgi:Bacterial Ig domain
VIAAAVILPLVPAHAVPSTPANIPSFFTSAAVDALPEGGVVLGYPYPDAGGPDLFLQTPKSMMLEQAASGMRFKLLGGFGWFPYPTGSHISTSPPPLRPKSVQEILDGAYWDTSSEKSLLSQTSATADLRAVLARYDVDAVIVQPLGAEPADVVRYVTATIGCPVYHSDVAVWLHVKQRLAHRVSGRDVNTCPGGSPVVPRVLSPGNGQMVSGTTVMLARATGFLNVASVAYYLSGGSLHGKWIARGSSTQIGWLTEWNTKTVPNGRYVLRSVAVTDTGSSSTSSGVVITVKN